MATIIYKKKRVVSQALSGITELWSDVLSSGFLTNQLIDLVKESGFFGGCGHFLGLLQHIIQILLQANDYTYADSAHDTRSEPAKNTLRHKPWKPMVVCRFATCCCCNCQYFNIFWNLPSPTPIAEVPRPDLPHGHLVPHRLIGWRHTKGLTCLAEHILCSCRWPRLHSHDVISYQHIVLD